METNFSELSLVIVVTAAVSILMRLIKQPLILGYILAGLIVGPSFFNLIHNTELFHAFSELGIALLLFVIGLSMRPAELRSLGKVTLTIASTLFLTIASVGYLVSTYFFDFSKTEALVTGMALFFSSTIIIVKILSDKKEQNRLHGQIAIGVILIDDLVATMALLFIVAGKNGGIGLTEISLLLGKGLLLLAFLAFAGVKILPKVSRHMASAQELLFLFAISWGFGIATLFELSGFSIEVGALFSGVALASSPYVQEIAARLKPLRDFFIVLFFITLGQSMNLNSISDSVLIAIVLSLIVIIGKPLVIMMTMGLLRYTKMVSFKAAINLSQISEFSIVLVLLAVAEGMVRPELASIITLVAIITIAASTYLMNYDEKLFRMFDKIRIKTFEKAVPHKERKRRANYEMVLFGYHHGGHEFIRTFQELKKKFLVIDYDPDVIDIMVHHKIDYLYGDATDTELLQEAGVEKSKMIVSTISNHETNLFLLKMLEELNPEAVIICHADNIKQATALYELGASYVMIPHHIGSERMGAFIRRAGIDKAEFNRCRQKHLAYLEEHFSTGVDNLE